MLAVIMVSFWFFGIVLKVRDVDSAAKHFPCWFCRLFVFQPKAQKGKAAEKVVHPYSRKAAYLAREEIRLKRKERLENKKGSKSDCGQLASGVIGAVYWEVRQVFLPL